MQVVHHLLTFVVLGFALVGGWSLGHKILKAGWGFPVKLFWGLVLLGVGGQMFNPQVPLVGLFNPLAALLASYGIFIVGSYLVKQKKWAKTWKPAAITVAVAFALLATIWYPAYLSLGALPAVPSASPATPTVSTPTPTPPVAAQPRSLRGRDRLGRCEDMTYDMRQDLARCAGR